MILVSDGVRCPGLSSMWIASWRSSGGVGAFDIGTKQWVGGGFAVKGGTSIWSDGKTMWVAASGEIQAYNMP